MSVSPPLESATNAAAAAASEQERRSRLAEASRALRNGPVGALVVAAVSAGLLFIGWLLVYFLIFMERGPVG